MVCFGAEVGGVGPHPAKRDRSFIGRRPEPSGFGLLARASAISILLFSKQKTTPPLLKMLFSVPYYGMLSSPDKQLYYSKRLIDVKFFEVDKMRIGEASLTKLWDFLLLKILQEPIFSKTTIFERSNQNCSFLLITNWIQPLQNCNFKNQLQNKTALKGRIFLLYNSFYFNNFSCPPKSL